MNAIGNWLRSFIRRNIVAEVPDEMDLCLRCGKVQCLSGEYADCSRRKARAAELRELRAAAAPDQRVV